jgi:uncharacterized membrane protein YfcA
MLLFDPVILLVLTTGYLSGSIVKGISGFGALLIAVPVMTLVVEPATAIALTSGPVFVSNLWQLFETRNAGWAIKRLWPYLAILIPAAFVGSQFLAHLDPRTSSAVIGGIVIAFSVLQIFPINIKITPQRQKAAGILASLFGGLIGGATIIAGSIMVMYLFSLKMNKDRFVSSIALVFLCNSIPVYLTLTYYGRYTVEELIVSVGLVLPALGGLVLGRLLRDHVSHRLFQKIVVFLLLIIGLVLLARAL